MIEKTEELLLSVRRNSDGFILGFVKDFLHNIISLPTTKKRLDVVESVRMLQDARFDVGAQTPQARALATLKRYNVETMAHIRNIITRIALMSYLDNPTDASMTRAYYFWGNPGSGKSTAARAICDFLGLPFSEVSIRSSADLSQAEHL